MPIQERVTVRSEIEGDRATIAGLEKIESSVEEAESAAASFGGRVDKEMRGAASATEQAEQATRSYAAAADRARASTRRVGSAASSTATNLGFELTAAAQDAQFGMAGVANQIPLISEQFTRLRKQSGSTRGALRSLLSVFLGPTGLLAIGTLGLQALPSILEFFRSIGDAAALAEEDLEALQQMAERAIAGVDLPEIQEVVVTDPEAAAYILGKLHDYAERASEPVFAIDVTPESVDEFDDVTAHLTAYGDDILTTCVRDYARKRAERIQLTEGLLTEQTRSGESGPYTVEDSNPINIDLDRFDRNQLQRKDKRGILPDDGADVEVEVTAKMWDNLTDYYE